MDFTAETATLNSDEVGDPANSSDYQSSSAEQNVESIRQTDASISQGSVAANTSMPDSELRSATQTQTQTSQVSSDSGQDANTGSSSVSASAVAAGAAGIAGAAAAASVARSSAQTSHDSNAGHSGNSNSCLLYTSPSPRDLSTSRMPSSA